MFEECPPPSWDVRFHQPVFEADRSLLISLPRQKLDPSSLSHLKDKHNIAENYEKWRAEREKKLFST